ncbi:MAG: SGNH/GDSL hydrolase family protein, partial [Solirubrobacteraceae bacterium]
MSVALLVTMAFASDAQAAFPAKVGPPTSIDALGDSITRGYDSQGAGCTALSDCPAFSWATGTAANVNSVYLRTKALNPSVLLARPITSSTAGGNDAKTGAKMSELAGQAKNAVNAPNTPDQVWILMGANDVCTSSEATMTPVASFRASFIAGLEVLSSGLPNARIDVLSIPNIYNLWSVLHTNTLADLTWAVAKICQAMLVNPTSTTPAEETRRKNVQKRNEEFNTVLGEVCAQYIHCHSDGGAAYAIKFPASDVNTLDYFHPNEKGQALAAETAWNTGPKLTDLTTPTTMITPERPPDGVEEWYRNSVTVTLTATDSEYAVAGTEYRTKLNGGAETPWIKYTAPITVSSEGQTTITARSVDVNGNIEESKSKVIKIDETNPTFTLTCPSGPVLLNSEATYTISNASDTGSGFASNPNGTFPINTSVAGSFTDPVQVSDKAGNTTTQDCNVNVVYPVPGVPYLSSGVTPNNTGVFSLAWTPSAEPLLYPSVEYTLQQRNADSEWSNVSEALTEPSFAFRAGTPESEGTWVYRVMAHEGANVTAFSAPSEPVVVDRTPPNAPTAVASREPDYAGGGGWYKESVEVGFTANGDPALSDGSPGSGVNLLTLSSPQTYSETGSYKACGTVADNVGNVSAPGCLTVQVDATPPSLEITCPATALVGTPASASFTASDGYSGLASEASGTVSINTTTAGEKTVSTTAVSNVGLETTKSCSTVVGYPNPGAPELTVGKTPNKDGLFTLSWTGADPITYFGLSYTLQHQNHSGTWTTVASGIEALSYEFSGAGEEEGTWVYRVQGSDPSHDQTTAWSPTSTPVVVDKTPPNAPTASAPAPYYAGGGGWYKNSATVSFTSNGDPALSDGSPGSGVNPASIPSPETFSTSGSHKACGTVADNAGNVSVAGCLTVQVDATPPSLTITCPATAKLKSKA